MITPNFKNIRTKILDRLEEAQNEILVAVYWFDNHQLFEKLCKKREEEKISVE